MNLRVATTLGPLPTDRVSGVSVCDRSILYRVVNFELRELELSAQHVSRKRPQSAGFGLSATTNTISALTAWYIAAAKLHLHAFCLLDDAASTDFTLRIAALYTTASALINVTLALDTPPTNFLAYAPFSCYQSFICAAFCILKIATNAFFQTLVNAKAGMGLLEAAIVALRKMSVVNNDLPARLSDVLAFLCALPDPGTVGGQTLDDVRLRQTRNRLSMSVVYDCLWTWRRQFKADASGRDDAAGAAFNTEDECPLSYCYSLSKQHSASRKLT